MSTTEHLSYFPQQLKCEKISIGSGGNRCPLPIAPLYIKGKSSVT